MDLKKLPSSLFADEGEHYVMQSQKAAKISCFCCKLLYDYTRTSKLTE